MTTKTFPAVDRQPVLGSFTVMKAKAAKFSAALSVLGLLASCAQMSPLEARNADTRLAAERVRTYADHNTLAIQYKDAVKELVTKADESKKLLEHYEEKGYLYGKQAQDKQSHTSALVRKYENDAKETTKLAAFHQKMASELAKGYASPAEIPQEQNSRENKVRTGT